ncbi:hypothetical protein IKG45_01335 [Candidatus Saccharibacteria bacterium]|nr:hypothetical protein [Candidatus Saccharibacteria bacterium]
MAVRASAIGFEYTAGDYASAVAVGAFSGVSFPVVAIMSLVVELICENLSTFMASPCHSITTFHENFD